MRPRFSIALLTEDDSETTWRGLRGIVQKFFRRFEDDGFTPRIEFVPAEPNVRPILIANNWRSTSPKDEPAKRELYKYLARKIAEPGGFVIFHYDGDARWSDRDDCRTRLDFEKIIRNGVMKALVAAGMREEQIFQCMTRLIECVPFYHIEAWTYQATERAIELCNEKYPQYRRRDIKKFEKWRANRAALDDEIAPKKQICFRDKHNEELARHVRVWEVVDAGCSMAGFVEELHQRGELFDALITPG